MVCRRGSLYTNMISNVSKTLQNFPRINVLPLRFLSYGGIEMLLLCPPKANTLELSVFQEHMHTTIVHRTNFMPWLSTVICNNEHSGTDLLTFTVEPEAGRCFFYKTLLRALRTKTPSDFRFHPSDQLQFGWIDAKLLFFQFKFGQQHSIRIWSWWSWFAGAKFEVTTFNPYRAIQYILFINISIDKWTSISS